MVGVPLTPPPCRQIFTRALNCVIYDKHSSAARLHPAGRSQGEDGRGLGGPSATFRYAGAETVLQADQSIGTPSSIGDWLDLGCLFLARWLRGEPGRV